MTERAKLAIKMGIEVEELKTILKMYKEDLKSNGETNPNVVNGMCWAYDNDCGSFCVTDLKFHRFWFKTNYKQQLCPFPRQESNKQLTHPPRIEYLTKLIEEMEL